MAKHASSLRESVTVRAPASLSNLGPGFDTLGIAVRGMGDVVSMSRSSGEATSVSIAGHGSIPTAPGENTASVAAIEVFRKAGYDGSARIHIEKGVPFGSGLGGSAASAAAGAAAANMLLGEPLDEVAVVECALAGEAVASKSMHGDNVIPALIGGAVLVDSSDPRRYRRIVPGADIHFAIVIPELQIRTADARRDLPDTVNFRAAVNHASALALLVHAITEGDVEALGRQSMCDQIVEPVRAARIPGFSAVRRAALDAGAAGCAISGSGPTLVALTASSADAARVAERMEAACRQSGLSCRSLVTEIDFSGATVVASTTE